MHRARGITLIELATTLTVLAVCAAVGVPALRAFMQQQRATGAMGSLTAHLAQARLAAVTHNRPVVVCPAAPPSAECVQDTDWSRGWMAFFDADGDRRPGGPGEILTAENTPLAGGLQLRTSNGRRQVRYLPDGRSAGSNVTFTLCDDGRLLGEVIVNNAGRTRTERPAAAVACP